jgi:biopolymer transport protein TolQ
MNVNPLLAVNNPFVDAYVQSDLVGKLIFIALITLSIISWVLIIYKSWTTHSAVKAAAAFEKLFASKQTTPLQVESNHSGQREQSSPFRGLYRVLQQHTLILLNRNHHFAAANAGQSPSESQAVSLSAVDIASIETHLAGALVTEKMRLEAHLYWLSTIVSLAPFLGLLGTVWGILTTFGELQGHSGGGSHQMVLSGLSLALATTVIGLVDAIPALIGYNYLKNSLRDFEIEMSIFAAKILSAVEVQYRSCDRG